jgi:hypothetical protein
MSGLSKVVDLVQSKLGNDFSFAVLMLGLMAS